jgi:protein SCO1/2
VDADSVRIYLQTHPEFLLEHEELSAAALARQRAGSLLEDMEDRRRALDSLARAAGGSSGPLRFRGHHRLIYFGFTQCPDVCPVTLATIAETMRLMGDKANLVQPLFISIDPERDTPGIVADYVHYFDSAMIGLTGTSEQIVRAQAAFGVTADSPVFRHSSWIYLVNENGQYLERFPGQIAPTTLAAAIMSLITRGTP